MMNINIKFCHNIDEGNISIKENRLNIKFGINGTGKSTIAEAIDCHINETKDIISLTPFKLLETKNENQKPEINGIDNIKTCLIFNEDYVEQFVFKQNELIANSFDIFINTPTYQKKVKEIENLIFDITSLFIDNQELNLVIDDFKKLSDNFKITKDGLSKASKGYKSLAGGNKIYNIPSGLEEYEIFLQSEQNVDWLDWHNNGDDFLNLSDNCPYCVSDVSDKKDKIRKISIEYDKNIVKNLELIIKTIDKLGAYFSNDAISTLKKITTKKEGDFEKAEIDFLVTVKKQIDDIVDKLEQLKFMSDSYFRSDKKAEDIIKSLIINIDLYDRLKSTKTEEIVNKINNSLNKVLGKVHSLQKEIAEQKKEVKDLIKKYQDDINQFLKNAGYKYEVVIEDEGYKLQLKHIDYDNLLIDMEYNLSFGEKNAFALALFMYDALSKNPDIIILDDPISSFDNNKKYAIMDLLFRKEKNFRGKTVLMLTHDIEPIINTIKVFNGEYIADAYCLELKDGVLFEKEITTDHLLTFPQICEFALKSKGIDDLIRLIYLRRYYEVIGEKDSNEYQVISNLFHKRKQTDIKDTRKEDEPKIMDKIDFENGVDNIKNKIPTFDYGAILQRICSFDDMKKLYNLTKNYYEKLQLFRVLDINFTDDKVLAKFINESYHIENEFINQLNPFEFNLVPEFIIKECDSRVNLKS